jgi:hypothetical protein
MSKGSMSTEGETLQVSVLPYRCSICPPLVKYRAPDKRFSHMLDSLSRWPWPACSFHSAQAVTVLEFHVLPTNCFVHRWFCVLRGPKPLLHHHNWLGFGKFQDAERFLIPCPRHVLSQLSPSGETCKYATVPSTQKKTWRDSLPIDMLLSAVSVLLVAQLSLEVLDGLVNYPVYQQAVYTVNRHSGLNCVVNKVPVIDEMLKLCTCI